MNHADLCVRCVYMCVYGVLFVPVFIREASKCWWKCFGSEGRGGDGGMRERR